MDVVLGKLGQRKPERGWPEAAGLAKGAVRGGAAPLTAKEGNKQGLKPVLHTVELGSIPDIP